VKGPPAGVRGNHGIGFSSPKDASGASQAIWTIGTRMGGRRSAIIDWRPSVLALMPLRRVFREKRLLEFADNAGRAYVA
jgi:hypothetical protein